MCFEGQSSTHNTRILCAKRTRFLAWFSLKTKDSRVLTVNRDRAENEDTATPLMLGSLEGLEVAVAMMLERAFIGTDELGPILWHV